MKKFKLFKMLAVLVVLITSINTVWAWHGVSLVGEMPAINGSPYYFGTNGSGSTETYAANGNGFKLLIYETYVGYCNKSGEKSSISSDGTGTRVYSDYGGSDDENVTYSGCNGIVCFHYDQVTGDHDYSPWVWITRPTVYLKNTWNTASWTWKSTTDEGNGYYYVDDVYGASGVNWGTNGSSAWQKNSKDVYIDCTPSPSDMAAGTRCRYRFNTNPSGSTWDAATPTLAIYKLVTITYNGNGKTGGTVPGNQDVCYNLNTAVSTNSGNLVKSGYGFYGWNTQADGRGTHYDAGGTINITGDITLYAEWGAPWCIKGSGTGMGDWDEAFQLSSTGVANTYSGTITLTGSKSYEFKVFDQANNSAAYGYANDGDAAKRRKNRVSFIGREDASAVLYNNGNDEPVMLLSAGGGTYTFTWNSSTHTLEVEYPDVTHPSTDYVYFYDAADWETEHKGVVVHLWGGSYTGEENMPRAGVCSFAGTTYYYAAVGDNSYGRFAGKENVTTYKTADLSGLDATNRGKYYHQSEAAWKTFDVDVLLDPDNGASTKTIVATYGAAMPSKLKDGSTSVTAPSFSGYTFGGYFKNSAGSSTQYYTNACASANNWDQTGSGPSIFAKWTQSVKLHDNNGDSNSGSTTATWKATGPFTISAPTKTGYTVEGYYAEVGCTNKVLTDEGAIADVSVVDGSSVTFISDSKWAHAAATTLYTKWNEIKHTVSVAAGANGSISGSVSSVTNVGIATASSEVTAVADDGYDFVNWTLPTGVTAADGYSAISNPIRINATEDGKTITANFTAHTYNISLEAGDHGAAAGLASVVFNTGELASVTHVSANAGYQLIGYYDGSTKVLNADGSFAADDVDGYITDGKWSKYDDDATLTAKFSPVTLTFNVDENGYWNTAANWTPACVPTIEHEVVLEKKVQVNVRTAQAKSVKIHHYGDYTGMLVVKETAGLLVAEDIKAKHAEEGAYEGTTDEDLQIRTSDLGNGGLITGNACAGNEAEYEFYVKACKYTYEAHSWYINQYVGIPFASMDAYELYGFNIFVYDDSEDDWRTPGSATMAPWTAYNLISKFTNDWPYYFIKGELNLPGKSGTQVFTCSWRGTDGSIDKAAGHEDYLFANSWTAPISIKDITASNCSGDGGADLVQTIYIFNAGFDGASEKAVGTYAGTWTSFPLASSSYMADAVIPATQAFMVTSKKGSTGATLTLSYNDHVYEPAIDANQINTFPTRAPRRVQANNDPNVLRIVVRNNDVDADQLYILERSDFSFGFDDGWDGNKVFGLSFAPQIYAINGEDDMAVNAIPDVDGMKIGFKAGKNSNEYTLAFEYADDAETIYLYDTDTQVYTQISSEATYSFTTSDTKEHERFVITRKAPQIVTGIEETIIKTNARKQMIDGTLYIIRDGRMYNAEGALVK